MRINVTGDQIASLSIIYRFGGLFRLFAGLANPHHKAVQHVYLCGIDLAGKYVEILYIFYRQVTGNLSHGSLNQAAPVFLFQLSQCLPLHSSKNRNADAKSHQRVYLPLYANIAASQYINFTNVLHSNCLLIFLHGFCGKTAALTEF